MTCPCEQRAQREEAERVARRKELERSIEWQLAVINEAREARGDAALTRSEFLAGLGGDETDDVPPPTSWVCLVVAGLYAVALVIALGRVYP